MKKITPNKPLSIITIASSALLLSSCSGLSSSFKLPDHKIDYKSSGSVKSLEVPPGLSSPDFDSTYAVTSGGAVSAAAYNRQGSQVGSGANVLPSIEGMQIKRSGNVSWLEVQAPASALWSKFTGFWASMGVTLKANEPRIGIMETEWAENRAGLPKDWLRKALGSVLQDTYDAGSRDSFKLRVERPSANVTNVFISHRRAEEMLAGGGTGVKWELRPSNPSLEAEMLARLSVFLQGGGNKTAATVAQKAQATTVAWSTAQGISVLNVMDEPKRVWLRVGVMLERVGMAIEGQDRVNGIFRVIYRGGEVRKEKRGWMSKVFKSSKDVLGVGGEYQIHLSGGGANTIIAATDSDGQPVSDNVARKILGKLKAEFER